jgi:hypothetical protein
MTDQPDTLIVIQNKRRFFIMIPMMVDDMEISPRAFRLYAHIVRRGECWENTRNLARACKMSTGAISRAKKELQQVNLIH